MSRWIITTLFAVLAAGSVVAAAAAWTDAFADPTVREWSIAGFVTLRTAALFAISVCVFVRTPPRRHSREPIAFVACGAALASILLLERPSDTAPTTLVVAGDLIALASWAWLLVSFVTLGRCFGLLPEARGLVRRGPYRLVRHPVYLGEFGTVAGLLIASATMRNAVVAAVFVAAQAVRMRLEERALTVEFPEYAAYASETPRLVPRVRPLKRLTRRTAVVGASLLAALLVAPLASTAPARGIATPTAITPAAGARTDGVPWFGWSPVAGAAQYEFQIAADPGMNAPVLGRTQDRFFTKNTRATLKRSLPDRTYWWRVRASTAEGKVSPWSAPRAFTKTLSPPPLVFPKGGQAVTYPTRLSLDWSSVDRAAKYIVLLAHDEGLATLVGGRPVETFATSFTPVGALTPGRYYWAVTPVDAQGNPGSRSAVESFEWVWPSRTTPRWIDLVGDLEVFDPQFSWDPVPGAARYELEVNPSIDFAPGSRVCCSGTTIGTEYSPTALFKDNRYYWRVRAFDVDGNPGVWNEGEPLEKRFDKVPPVAGTSIQNLRIRDNLSDPGSDLDPDPTRYATKVPVITWDPVAGAASYQVEVTPTLGGSDLCDWSSLVSHWEVKTTVNAWTPLGSGLLGNPPFGDWSRGRVATDAPRLEAGRKYCARVRARTDRDAAGTEIYGDYTYVVNGRGTHVNEASPDGPAFTWLGYPDGGPCSGCTTDGYLGPGDYTYPTTGTTTPRTPYFTWKPIAGKQSYFVIVAKDSQFTNIVDYAFTQLPAYSPRFGTSRPTSYPDETTAYYWVVLPATELNGTGGAAGDPLRASRREFQKQSVRPELIAPGREAEFSGQPTFRWKLIEGARQYRFQVSQDERFGTLLENVVTNSTAYTSNTTYPADVRLFWRVRADDENLFGLAWSETGTFRKRLETPRVIPGPAGGDFIPTWVWEPVPGAVSYDVHANLPDGTERDLVGFRTAAFTPILMYGTGKFTWSVRANFPRQPVGTVPGPYSTTHAFTRTIAEPTGVRSQDSKKYPLLLWDPKPGPKTYRVQISARADFRTIVEDVPTDNTSYAPLLNRPAYTAGGTLFWRVAAVDEGRNIGDWSPTQTIGTVRQLKLSARGGLKRGRMRVIVVTVRAPDRRPVAGAAIRVSGAGVRVKARTSRAGTARFRLRAKRRGVVVFTATKSGYAAAKLKLRVK